MAIRMVNIVGLWVVCWVLGGMVLAGCPRPLPRAEMQVCKRIDPPAFVVGANLVDVKSPDGGPKRGFGRASGHAALLQMKQLGLSAVVFPVPLFAANADSSVIRPGPLHGPEGLLRLEKMIRWAHEAGLVVALVPHLFLDDGAWRGTLFPRDEKKTEAASLANFFTSYWRALAPIAALAEENCVEVLSAAMELKKLSSSPVAYAHFLELFRKSRAAFSGKLTYSSNWDEADDIPFWDELDSVGINAFFPLAADPGAGLDALNEGALKIHRQMHDLRAKTQKPIFFLEAGFKAVPGTHVRPWEWPAEVGAEKLPLDEDAQWRAYRAHEKALRSIPAVDWITFWAVPADPRDSAHPWRFEPPQGFSFVGKKAEAIIRNLAAEPPKRASQD
jgi:hypothetical protein